MSSCILLMMGIPASGKTTLCNHLKTNFNSAAYHILHFHFDELISSEAFIKEDFSKPRSNFKMWRTAILYAINDWIKENLNSPSEKKDMTYLDTIPDLDIIDKVKKQINHLVAGKVDDWKTPVVLVLDDNFHLQSMRHVYYTLAKHYRLGFGSVFCDIDINSALSRNASRPRPVETMTIEKMTRQFEKPDPSKVWEQFTLCISPQLSYNQIMYEIGNLIGSISEHAFSYDQDEAIHANRLQSQIICSSSQIHQFDEFLRKSISKIMLSKDQDWKKQNGKRLSVIKGNILDQLKSNKLEFEIDVNNEELTIQKISEYFELSLTDCKS